MTGGAKELCAGKVGQLRNALRLTSDVHDQRDVVAKVVRHDPPQDVKDDVGAAGAAGAVARAACTFSHGAGHRATHRACPMWAESYTVGPHMYQDTALPFLGMNGTCRATRREGG